MGNIHPRNRKKVEDAVKAKSKGDKFTSADLVPVCKLPATEIGSFLKDVPNVKITGRLVGRNVNVWEVIA